ncbi:MAG: flippase-like domain-containing protein [Actinomycetota bacterium]|nr:flippase-like domain-containing protein [Actinomycetota bacterium]
MSAIPWRQIVTRGVLLALGAVSLYYLLPQILAVFEQAPRLENVKWRWFFLMAALMTGAFAAQWQLTRIAVPGVSWFVAATSQLSSNAATKVTPGGAMVGGATYFQMLSVSGVPPGQAAAALAAVSFLSTLVLLSLPGVAVAIAALSAPIPQGLLPVAVAGTLLFVVMFAGVVVLVRFNKPLCLLGRIVEVTVKWFAQRFHKPWKLTAESFVQRRDEVVAALGKRWRIALAAAVVNWMLDYLTLVVALIAIGAEPRPSLVLLAFAASAVLGMIPITPGGLGFVEAGLTAMLTLAGIPATDALLATLAYRMFQYWLPIPAGFFAYLLFRRRYGRPSDLPSPSEA